MQGRLPVLISHVSWYQCVSGAAAVGSFHGLPSSGDQRATWQQK